MRIKRFDGNGGFRLNRTLERSGCLSVPNVSIVSKFVRVEKLSNRWRLKNEVIRWKIEKRKIKGDPD